jgi:hypothetical protein
MPYKGPKVLHLIAQKHRLLAQKRFCNYKLQFSKPVFRAGSDEQMPKSVKYPLSSSSLLIFEGWNGIQSTAANNYQNLIPCPPRNLSCFTNTAPVAESLCAPNGYWNPIGRKKIPPTCNLIIWICCSTAISPMPLLHTTRCHTNHHRFY